MVSLKAIAKLKGAFKAVTKDDLFRPYNFDEDFRSSNEGNDVSCSFYDFELRCQKKNYIFQPFKVWMKFFLILSMCIL